MLFESARGLLQLLAPARCAGCEEFLDERSLARGFCEVCWLLVDEAPRLLKPPLPSASVFVYGGPLAAAIVRMKYAGKSALAKPLGKLLAQAAAPYSDTIDWVVPIPLHPKRLRERGFNQATLLATPVAKALDAKLGHSLLKRIKHTAPQASLNAQERAANVAHAFYASAQVRGARVLLIDDVRTTGATLASAALTLRHAGASAVSTLALAHAESTR